jgi:hypothetical protein
MIGRHRMLFAAGGASRQPVLSQTESQSIQFKWDVFNVLNLVRFNAQGVGTAVTSLNQSPNEFGTYSSLLTQPRVMQFALRYEF